MKTVQCEYCGKDITKHPSRLNHGKKFCSPKCSQNFYALPENRTDAQKEADKVNAARLLEYQKTEKFKKAQVEAIAKLQKDEMSKDEISVQSMLADLGITSESQQVIDYYSVDLKIDNTCIDVHGNYWHNSKEAHDRSSRKRTFLENKGYEYLEFWTHEIKYTNNPIEWARKPIEVTILCGQNGVGKSYAASKISGYTIIDYDNNSFGDCIEQAKTAENPMIVTPIQAKRMMDILAKDGIRSRIVVMREDEEVVTQRIESRNGKITQTVQRRAKRYRTIAAKYSMFVGTQDECIKHLNEPNDL
jgi:very-short-patch-repair endonuclease